MCADSCRGLGVAMGEAGSDPGGLRSLAAQLPSPTLFSPGSQCPSQLGPLPGNPGTNHIPPVHWPQQLQRGWQVTQAAQSSRAWDFCWSRSRRVLPDPVTYCQGCKEFPGPLGPTHPVVQFSVLASVRSQEPPAFLHLLLLRYELSWYSTNQSFFKT